MATSAETQDYDALVIGAGISGLYQLYRLRELGMRVLVLEAGSGVGGTWYWNRYPGARFDSESYSYGYSFSQELLEEWNWSEHFAPQSETLRYLNFVADKFDLRSDIRFHSRVTQAHYQEEAGHWDLTVEDGSRYRARFLITAIGPLSAPTLPRIEGVETFQGEAFHTARWPHQPVSFVTKRVAVVGTGATGPTGARPCTTARSTRRRSAASRPATPRCSPAAVRPSPASCTRPTRAAPSR